MTKQPSIVVLSPFCTSAIWTPFHSAFAIFQLAPYFFSEHIFAGEGETPPPEKQDRGPGLANEKVEAVRASAEL